MLRREELGELGAENCEGRHAEQRGEMSGTGVVADEAVRVGKLSYEVFEIAGFGFDKLNLPAFRSESRGYNLEALARPQPHGMAGAGVDDGTATVRRRHSQRGSWQGEAECVG